MTTDPVCVLLATAQAYVFGESAVKIKARILCDPGSQNSFITQRLASLLNLRRFKCSIQVEGIGGSPVLTKGTTIIHIQSMYSDFHITVQVIILASISGVMPAKPVNTSQWLHLQGLQLADEGFATPGEVDLLIGADTWGQILCGGVISHGSDAPYAQQTQLGWVIFGPTSEAVYPSRYALTSCTQQCSSGIHLDELLQHFWQTEQQYDTDSLTEDVCNQIFLQTHQRTPQGRYVVQLPLKGSTAELGDSFRMASRRFQALERQLSTDPDLHAKYVNFMREYRQLGHMELVDQPHQEGFTNYYIPHHAVLSKFRVVFNASARTTTGISLNDLQLVGPTIQEPLINILLRFRQYRVAVSADIEKMFRQVLVAPHQRNLQRILWRESVSEPIRVYQLTTVTYGMASSPYNAIRALQQCAYDNHQIVQNARSSEQALRIILTSFYVDDFLWSCDSDEEAIKHTTNISRILSAGQFMLRKWNSNSKRVLSYLSECSSEPVQFTKDPFLSSVLGLQWDPVADQLYFKVALPEGNTSTTKRTVLSEIARIYDPIGLVAPVVVLGKMLMQELWSSGISWDETLPSHLDQTWKCFRNSLDNLNQLQIPRWLGDHSERRVVLHGFCDASLKAYAAVIYAQTITEDGDTQAILVTARTRVAPLKGATVPRLELSAAALLAETMQHVRKSLSLEEAPYHLWSDSRIVLCWLRRHPVTLKPYVSGRVRKIQDLTSPDRWQHVTSKHNPADCASRGVLASDLAGHQLWWHGPQWLTEATMHKSETIALHPEELAILHAEERSKVLAFPTFTRCLLVTRCRDNQVIPLTERYSSLHKLLRTVAYMMRWLPRHKKKRSQTFIDAEELDKALMALVRIEQQRAFGPEISRLQANLPINLSSKLLSLKPYLDEQGILRVGGRIDHAAVPYDQRYPIILSGKGCLLTLLLRQTHNDLLHGGTQLMLQTLRQRFWIIHCRQAVKTYIHQCVICRRHRRTVLQQQMASLPKARVQMARPFLRSGVDYCGPFNVRVGTKRSKTTIKTYLAIFVCMATRAVHIEVVDDLSSQAFLDAFTRFISRRGRCADLYSDNGTAFIGANRLLQEDLANWHCTTNQQAIADAGTQWHFITPSAPHQGGIWEAAVKSTKHHLLRCVGNQTLWPSQLSTLAARIEACLNSRPITPVYDDAEDQLALTPGHFLIGSSLQAVPEPRIPQVPVNRLKHWEWIRKVHQEFWSRWSKEYLVTLQQRVKWMAPRRNIQEGDVVIIQEANLPPTQWCLGRVTAVHPGSDNLVRNVTLKTSNGILRRPVQKVCLLLDFESPDSTGQDVKD